MAILVSHVEKLDRPSKRLQEGVLYRVFRIFPIPGNAIRSAQDFLRMSPAKLCESRRLPALGRCQQLSLFWLSASARRSCVARRTK